MRFKFFSRTKIDQNRISCDLDIFQHYHSAQALGSYLQKVVPKDEELQRFARARVNQIAKGYEDGGKTITAAIVWAALDDFEQFRRIFGHLMTDGKEGAAKAAVLVINAQRYLSPQMLMEIALRFESSLPSAAFFVYSTLSLRSGADKAVVKNALSKLAKHEDDNVAVMALSVLGDKRGAAERLRRVSTVHPDCPKLLEEGGDLVGAEEALYKGLASTDDITRLIEFYERNNMLTEKAFSFYTSVVSSAMSIGAYWLAYEVYAYLYNRLPHSQLPKRDMLITKALFGKIDCLFLMDKINDGLKILRSVDLEVPKQPAS